MINKVKAKIREVKNFPMPGVNFKDIMPVVQDASCYAYVIDQLTAWAEKKKPEMIVGIESRGFLFAAPVAYKLGLGLTVIRKKGKLPRQTVTVRAPNEYAVEYFEMHADSLQPGERVLIIDDLIATGSSSISSIDLINKLGGEPVGFAALVELVYLGGSANIKKAHPELDIFSLIKLDK